MCPRRDGVARGRSLVLRKSELVATAVAVARTVLSCATTTTIAMAVATSNNTPDTNPFSVSILWSTQTGRAKACARRTARIVGEQGIGVTGGGYGCAFDDCEPNLVHIVPEEKRFLLLFVSTTGDGEQCDSISQTWKALRNKSLTRDLFQNTRFAMFCLGDRAYGPQFCAGGRKLAARLVQLGATPCCSLGYGDDGTPNGGAFFDLDQWLQDTLLPAMSKEFPNNVPIEKDLENMEQTSRYRVVVGKDTTNGQSLVTQWESDEYNHFYIDYFETWCPLTAYQYSNNRKRLQDSEKRIQRTAPLFAKVVSNDRITASDWEQDTRHLRLHVVNNASVQNGTESINNFSELPYRAGDVATILPFNRKDAVSKFLSVLPQAIRDLADCELEINNDHGNTNPWPRRCTLRGMLTYCADISSLPEREDLRQLSRYCQLQHDLGRDQRDKLLSLSETSGAALFADYILREKRTWTDILYDFDSILWQNGNNTKPLLTLEALLSLLPPIRPRHFSIASAPSSQQANAGHDSGFGIELCVAVVQGTTPLGRRFEGLCSNFLASQTPGSKLRLWIKPGSFGKLPLTTTSDGCYETPILCIGAGTGVAPLRSLVLERVAVQQHDEQNKEQSTQQSDADNILVFGCRKQQSDYYYKEEWEPLVRARQLYVLTAFSRDQWHKIYVQQVLGNNESLITRHVLDRGGAIYVAGGAKMARAVKDEILECLAKSVGEAQAKLFLKKLHQAGRYSVEAWS